MDRVRSSLSYANVMATVALFIALGSGSYAATKIGTADIKNGAVTAKKIKSSAVTASKIRGDAVTSSRIRPGSVHASDLASDASQQVRVEYATGFGSVSPQGLGSAFLECPEGTILVSVGVERASNHLRLVSQGIQTDRRGRLSIPMHRPPRKGFSARSESVSGASRSDPGTVRGQN
jgi:hypothetical protein